LLICHIGISIDISRQQKKQKTETFIEVENLA